MTIDEIPNNCGLVAFRQILPDRDEGEIIEACYAAGFRDDMGMFPHHIEEAMRILRVKYTKPDLTQYKPTFNTDDMRTAMTLQQALSVTKNDVCLIRVNGHVLASNRGIPLDVNARKRGARRRVLGLYVIHNATIPRRESLALSNDPRILFVHDIRRDANKGSSRAVVYEKVFKVFGDPPDAVQFSDMQRHGYTRRMLRRHLSRGDAIIVE